MAQPTQIMREITPFVALIIMFLVLPFLYNAIKITVNLLIYGTTKKKKKPRIGRDSWPIPRSFRPRELGQTHGR